MDIVARKAALRSAVLQRRDGLDPNWRAEASARLAALELPFQPSSGLLVSGFWPMRSEVDVRPLMQRLAEAGCRLSLPRIEEGRLVFRHWAFGDPLEEGGFGTRVPAASAALCQPEVILTPLVAFDGRGARLGYGKGYYDGAIARLSFRRPLTLGIAFSVQQVQEVPTESHDRMLDYVLTERGYAAGGRQIGAGATR
jgi:5-formyltetrahydrofolate cyclo-ligase